MTPRTAINNATLNRILSFRKAASLMSWTTTAELEVAHLLERDNPLDANVWREVVFG